MPDSETKATLDVIRRFNDAFNRHDVDGVMALMTSDCVFENTQPPPDGERFVGAAPVRAFWKRFFESTPGARFETEEIFSDGRPRPGALGLSLGRRGRPRARRRRHARTRRQGGREARLREGLTRAPTGVI